MKWEKQVPDKVGWWIRLNIAHHPQFHYVVVHPEFHDGVMRTDWGQDGMVRLDDEIMQMKMQQFWWFGPLPEFPERRF